jgi:predicted NBD/HSP70 family sugar kinase
MARAREAVAAAVVTIIDLFNPDLVIIGGGSQLRKASECSDPLAMPLLRLPSEFRRDVPHRGARARR